MNPEYRLSYTANEIDEKLGKIDILEEALANAGGGSGSTWRKVKEFVTTEEVAYFETDVDATGEVIIFIIAAPTSTNTAGVPAQIQLNSKGAQIGYIKNAIYTDTYYTRRVVRAGHLPKGFISYQTNFGYNMIGEAESLYTNAVTEDIYFGSTLKKYGITNIGYQAMGGVFGIGSKIVVYARG